MLSWILVVLAFSVMIIIHELGHFLVARRVGIKVETFSIGFGPPIFSVKKGGVEYRIGALPLGGYVKLLGEDPSEKLTGDKSELASQPVGNRFKVFAAGSALNYLLGYVLLSVVFMIGYPVITTKVGALVEDYPAKKAGMQVGDRVLAIDGKAVGDWEELTGIMHKKTEGDVKLTIDRDGKKLDLVIRPMVRETKDVFGNKVRIAQVGIMNSDERSVQKYGFFGSFAAGGKKLVNFTYMTYKGLWSLITGKLPFKENVMGPVGIFGTMNAAAKIGVVPFLLLTALISALLGMFNVLPVPPLDGGLILFLGIEKIMGRPLSRRVQEVAMQAGWMFFIALMLFATYGDIFRMMGK
ncbi:MAG: RIP metalloprotease RseP [Candidatus Omnitrophica bacterium]|nr:RIP metalloprotease RseP [Candidatus Omnitrophota bacterium]MDD5310785.1 RIP metalloprotease RseP [Candidatus Omnitrophota bacterium]